MDKIFMTEGQFFRDTTPWCYSPAGSRLLLIVQIIRDGNDCAIDAEIASQPPFRHKKQCPKVLLGTLTSQKRKAPHL